MDTIVFATNNRHKVEEIKRLTGNTLAIITLQEAGIKIDIPEPHDTLEANALEKSVTIHNITGLNCFGEDTGLEVEALNGAPGVKSARYAGNDNSSEANIAKLLANMAKSDNRRARFRTVISLIFNDRQHLFEGICEGEITHAPTGSNGFGYDPVFIPEGSNKTFAQMTMDEKNQFSHRKRATEKLVQFLSRYGKE